MENFNRVLSFALGLVIVVVFLAIISGKIDLRKRLPFLTRGSTVQTDTTPTPIKKGETFPTPTTATGSYKTNQIKTEGTNGTVKTIPATGSPTILLPLFFSSFSIGYFLRKRK